MKRKQNEVRITASGISVVKFNQELVVEELKKMHEKKPEPCKFCTEFCGNDWCPAKEEK